MPRLKSPSLMLRAAIGLLMVSLVLVARSNGWARGDNAGPDRYLVLIVMDGFRPDYMRAAPMRHLHQLMHSGMTYTRAWVGQLETETPTGHATIVTGVYPRKHGVIGFGWRDATGSNFTWMPTDLRLLNAGQMENLIEADRVPTISDLLHRRYPGAKSASMSGEKYYAADAMGTGADYVVYGKRTGPTQAAGIEVTPIGRHIPPMLGALRRVDVNGPPYAWVEDQFVGHLAARFLQTARPRVLLVNLPGTDIEGHVTGGVIDHPDMTKVIASADGAIGTIMNAYKRAGLYNRTDFVVTADHGMIPNSHIVPIKSMYGGVRASGASWLEDDFLTTAGYLFIRQPNLAGKVATELESRHYPGVEGALYKVQDRSGLSCKAVPATERALGSALTQAYVDLCDTLAAPNGPEVVLPYREDTMGLTVPGQRHWGNHGGLSWGVQQIPLVISGPGVRHGTSNFPAQLVDIAPTVETLLGLPVPPGVDGIVLADALDQAGQAAVAAQGARMSPRSADVTALIDHAANEKGAAWQTGK